MADNGSIKYRKPQRKKSKKKSKYQSDSDESKSSSDEAPVWIEAKPKVSEKPKINRDEWMSISTDFGPTVSRGEIKKYKQTELKEKKPDRLQLDNPGQHERELNPYWRDGGQGIPTESENQPKDVSLPSSSVGDGGLNWLRRAYQRAKEQAKEEGRSLEDVAAERWGSLDKLEKLLESAESRSQQRGPSRNSFEREKFYEGRRERRRYNDDRKHGDDRRRDKDKASARNEFYKPDSNERERSPRRDDFTSSRRDEWSQRKPAWRVKSEKNVPEEKEKEKYEKKTELTTSTVKIEVPMEIEQLKPLERAHESPKTKLTDEELNQLGAKIIKAEILGNTELVNKLRKQMQDAQKDRQFGVNQNQGEEERTIVINKSSGPYKNKRSKIQTHDQDGRRTRYFADDDKHSLKEMFEREKRNTVEDENILFSKMVSKGKDLDGDVDYVGRVTEDGAQHSKAVKDVKSAKVFESCSYCYGSASFPKHLVVATGNKVYICVPKFASLQEGHCFIVPMQHVIAATQLDEDVWEEMQDFRKALTKMFETSDLDVVFFENSRNLRSFPHMYLQCVPLPRDAGDTAPIYFKKALLECETEWSHNKKVVDLSQKDVRKAVPKGLPYFAVDFGLQGGFAHVIEDERLFPCNFAQEIIGGILDLEPNLWRKPPIESFENQQSKRFDLIKQFKAFDWTKT